MTHKYLKFDFELGYGVGLPVIIEITDEQRSELEKYFQKSYSDDDYISFDENYNIICSYHPKISKILIRTTRF